MMVKAKVEVWGKGQSLQIADEILQIDLVAEFARVRVDKVPRVADIEHDV